LHFPIKQAALHVIYTSS